MAHLTRGRSGAQAPEVATARRKSGTAMHRTQLHGVPHLLTLAVVLSLCMKTPCGVSFDSIPANMTMPQWSEPQPLQYKTELSWWRGADAARGDVTLISHSSYERLTNVDRLVRVWGCAASVAIYIPVPQPDPRAAVMVRKVSEMVDGWLAAGLRGAAVSLVFARTHVPVETSLDPGFRCDPGDCDLPRLKAFIEEEYDRLYPVNFLRNVAISQVATELTFILDVDYVPSHGMCGAVAGGDPVGREALTWLRAQTTPPAALVVPAFELDEHLHLPRSFEEAATLYRDGSLQPFKFQYFPQGHNATDFARWSGATERYQVQWNTDFEPYVILLTRLVPPFDERFRGYGRNKISHLHYLSIKGYQWWVLPRQYVTHINHGYNLERILYHPTQWSKKSALKGDKYIQWARWHRLLTLYDLYTAQMTQGVPPATFPVLNHNR